MDYNDGIIIVVVAQYVMMKEIAPKREGAGHEES